ncbi:MAG: DUF4280 domain-containing protein [Verrucomicrobia bacterium]|nr:DUF4280 domain-containing protein [Verrucomicrobiota bacterium]
MPPLATTGCTMMCTFGVAPSVLNALQAPTTLVGTPAATIMDNKPMANIPPFGMCMSLANPTVASATAAAMGVLTPMPCIPNTTAPWVPGSPTVMVGNAPALNITSKCMCMWGGVISIIAPSQVQTMVP